jgi:trans-aconitate methyltransferase
LYLAAAAAARDDLPTPAAYYDDIRRDFVADYTARIARAYPRQHDGRVLLRVPRLFIVATR